MSENNGRSPGDMRSAPSRHSGKHRLLKDVQQPYFKEEADDMEDRKSILRQRLVERDVELQDHCTNGTQHFRRSISSAGMSQEQIANSLSEAISKITSNKYTAKNAFNCNIIDLMSSVVHSETPNFQSAGSALDAAARIYAYRVDNIYQETNKVIGGLTGKPQKKQQDDELDDDENGDRERDDGNVPVPFSAAAEVKKKKRQRNLGGRTVEQNEASLNLPASVVDYEDDSLFRKVCSQLDGGGLNGLLLNNVFTSGDSSALKLHSLSAPTAFPRPIGPDQNKLHPEIPLLSKESFNSACPSLERFQFSEPNRRDSLTSQEMLNQLTGSVPADEDVEFERDEQAAAAFGVDDKLDHDETEITTAVSTEPANVSEMLVANPADQEYSYFDETKINLMKGPNHWKIGEEKVPKKLLPKRKPTSMLIDLGVRVPDSSLGLSSLGRDRRAAFLRAATALENREEQTVKAEPGADEYSMDKLRNFNIKSETLGRETRWTRAPADDGLKVEAYDYGNPNDTANFVAPAAAEDMEDGPDMPDMTDLFGGAMEDALSQDCQLPGNMVFSKRAKRVDYRKLKDEMWELLAAPEEPREESGVSPRKREKLMPEKMLHPVPFSGLYKKLPNKLSQAMNDNLSVPIAFVGFLHLCNEKELRLTGNADMSDFVISQD